MKLFNLPKTFFPQQKSLEKKQSKKETRDEGKEGEKMLKVDQIEFLVIKLVSKKRKPRHVILFMRALFLRNMTIEIFSYSTFELNLFFLHIM